MILNSYKYYRDLLSEYLREFRCKNGGKPVFPTLFSLSFSLSGLIVV